MIYVKQRQAVSRKLRTSQYLISILMKEHALAAFRQPPLRLNCAQSVLHGYQQVSNDMNLSIDEMKPFGGGRAPGGLCGALHAACTVAPHETEDFKAQFERQLGSVLCRELRARKQHPCEVCVAHAAELLENHR